MTEVKRLDEFDAKPPFNRFLFDAMLAILALSATTLLSLANLHVMQGTCQCAISSQSDCA